MRFLVVMLLLSFVIGCSGEKKVDLTNESAKISYSLGVQIGMSYKESHVQLDPAALGKGFADAMNTEPNLLTDEEIQEVLQAYHRQLNEAYQKKMQAEGQINKEAGDAFLAANKTKEGVKTTASGLQYKVINEGSGRQPKLEDQVTVHYKGTLIDGTEFDSSIKRGQPATFPVNGVIPGWQEAIPLMKEGAKWELYVPSELAYGPRGAGEQIRPNSVLIFEVELLSIGQQ
jgi:FKBP-type peptidyl-prolyl cis-trans isomerase